jgi:HTH-type transcriptional regulator / antitoxin HipB
MPTLEDKDSLPIDWTGVRSTKARSQIEEALGERGWSPDPSARFWDSLQDVGHATKWRRLLVMADLSECAGRFQKAGPNVWAASMRTTRPLIMALVRNERDREFASQVDVIARSSEGRFMVCELKTGTLAEAAECVARALVGLDPEAIVDLRYSVEERALWLEFGDGVQGTLRWDDMPLGKASADLRPDTAAVADDGSCVQVLRRNGEVFDIDAASLRGILESAQARRLETQAEDTRQQVGARLRHRRKELGLTQSEVAARSGLDQALVSKLESGRHQPRFDTLEKYAGALGMPGSELLR